MYKTKKAFDWQELAKIRIRQMARSLWGTYELSAMRGLPIEVTLWVCRESWTGKAKLKRGLYVRPDITNFIKGAEDALCGALGLDDAAVVEFRAVKQVRTGENLTIMELRFI